MRRSLLLPAVWLADQLAGDPEGMPHPVRAIGWTIARAESMLRGSRNDSRYDLAAGGTATAAIVLGSYAITRGVLQLAKRRRTKLADAFELLLGWTCLAARNLQDEAGRVLDAVDCGDLACARLRLARIVGRDTATLEEAEICRAVIETVAESASDGIVAPLFYMAAGGIPFAMAYKAVNTLDSMIGHADRRYFWFGKAAARLDDAANFLPARMTAGAITVAAALDGGSADAHAALRVWRRDGRLHKSPNAGQPESAMAGALGVRLGGRNTYAAEVWDAPWMGGEFPPASARSARRALRQVKLVTLLSVAAMTVWAMGARERE